MTLTGAKGEEANGVPEIRAAVADMHAQVREFRRVLATAERRRVVHEAMRQSSGPTAAEALEAAGRRPIPDDPDDLAGYASPIASLGQTDGLVYEIVRRLPSPVGVSAYLGKMSARLIWSGGAVGILSLCFGHRVLMVVPGKVQANFLARAFQGRAARVRLDQVTPENVNTLVSSDGMDGGLDVLVLDLRGKEYWTWDALEACTPSLVVCRFNDSFGPDARLTIPADPPFMRGGKQDGFAYQYWGAGLAALVSLARRKGYRLVAVGDGRAALFLRRGVLPEFRAIDTAEAWRRAIGLVGGEPADVPYDEVIREFERQGWPLIEVSDAG